MKNQQEETNSEISFKELINLLGLNFKYLKSKWIQIFTVGIIGSIIGLTYAFLHPVKYVSKMTFVVEDAKSSMSGLASLAGQFGFDLGSAVGGGVFSGDNILLFFKSENLCRQTLFTPYEKNGKVLLADKYAEVTKLKKSWSKNKKIGDITFAKYTSNSLPRLEDSLMQEMIADILENDLIVSKPDKKASFIEVKASMRDEKLSQLFTTTLVKIATDTYVESKTKVKAANVAQLQKRADSLYELLNAKTVGTAVRQQDLVDINPALRSAPISVEISTRDKTIIGTVFGEVVKNLEFAKFSLNQETPVIQIIDKTTLPLFKEKAGKLKWLILVGFLSAFFFIIYLLIKKWYLNTISS
jgi:uncharacterized protein involved in exopolysaccharide biosynthesis